MNTYNYAERMKAAGRRIAHFIAADETMQQMTRGEIKHALDSAYRDISAIFDNVDLAQASSTVIAKHGSPAEPDDPESHSSSGSEPAKTMTGGEFTEIMRDYEKEDRG